MNKLVQRTMIVGFCLLMGLPLLATVLEVGTLTSAEFSAVEMRARTDFPQWENVPSVSAWTTRFDQWFTDRYAFRHILAKSHARIQYNLFKQSAFPGAVIIGKNNFLFLGDDHAKIVSVHAGLPVWPDETLLSVSELLYTASEWLGTHDIPLLISIAPDKSTIYGENLPAWIPAPNRNLPVARLRDMVKAKGQTNFHYNPEVLLDAKKRYPGILLYHSGDTHWNELGSFVYYQDMMQHLEVLYGKPLRILQTPEFVSRTARTWLDLELFVKQNEKREWVTVDTRNWSPLPEKQVVKPQAMWRAPADGFGPFVTTNPGALNPQKLLLVGDSFSERMLEYVYRTFASVLYLHSNSSAISIADAVKWYKPDMVVFEVVERAAVERFISH